MPNIASAKDVYSWRKKAASSPQRKLPLSLRLAERPVHGQSYVLGVGSLLRRLTNTT